MANNAECKSIGKGTVKIKMFNGVVQTLTNVIHVPDLKKNLISLGTLDSKGCKCIVAGGVVKVVRGAMVIMKGALNKILYRLAGSTIIKPSGADSRKKDVSVHSVEVDLDGRGETNIFGEASSIGPRLQVR